jgi:caffeoyl-CoA O-methyltransferase
MISTGYPDIRTHVKRIEEMEGTKFVGFSLVAMAMALGAISLAPEWGLCKTGSQQRGCSEITAQYSALAKNESEMRILSVLDDIRHGPCTDDLHGRLLRILAESTKAKNVVEIGTGNGYSALWLCLGLKATGGKLITHEKDHEQVLLARANFKRAGVEGLVTVIEGDAHRTVAQLKEPIDILFLDAEGGNLDYLNQLLPQVRPGGLILADNMRKPKPDPQFIKAITTNPNLETIFLNMRSTGISLTVKKN